MKAFAVPNVGLESNLFPEYYLFRQKIQQYSQKDDIISFRLGDDGVLSVLTDGEHSGQKFVEHGALFVKNSSVKRYSVSEFDGFYISTQKNETLIRSRLQKDDVLFTTIGNIGVSAVVNENVENANINQNVVRMRINKRFTTPQYLSCFLNSRITRFQVSNLFTGNIYPMLSYPKIKSLKVFIRSRDVEDVITRKMILAEQCQTEALKLIKHAQSLMSRELNIKSPGMNGAKCFAIPHKELYASELITPTFFSPASRSVLKEIENNSNCDVLGNIADFKSGDEVGSANYKDYMERDDSDVPFIRTSDFVNYEVDNYPDYYVESSVCADLDQHIGAGEILFTKDGKIGQVAMTVESDRCILSSGILRIIPKPDKIDPYYLFIALSLKEIGQLQARQRTVVASTIPHLREDRISDFKIPIIENQSEVIEPVRKAFALKNKRKQLIAEARMVLEQSLMG